MTWASACWITGTGAHALPLLTKPSAHSIEHCRSESQNPLPWPLVGPGQGSHLFPQLSSASLLTHRPPQVCSDPFRQQIPIEQNSPCSQATPAGQGCWRPAVARMHPPLTGRNPSAQRSTQVPPSQPGGAPFPLLEPGQGEQLFPQVAGLLLSAQVPPQPCWLGPQQTPFEQMLLLHWPGPAGQG